MENNISCTKIFGNYARLLLSNSLIILDFLRFFKAFSVWLNVRNMEGNNCIKNGVIITELNSINHCKIRHSEVITTSVIWREEKICQNTCFLGTPKQISFLKILIFRAFFTIQLSCIMREEKLHDYYRIKFENPWKIRHYEVITMGVIWREEKLASKMDYFRADIIILTYRKHSSIKGFRA